MTQQHYTRSTISAAIWCPKCQKQTQHRIDDRRKGPCLVCIAKLDEKQAKKTAPTQGNLFSRRRT